MRWLHFVLTGILSNTRQKEIKKRCEHLTYLFLKAFGGARVTKTSPKPTPQVQALELTLIHYTLLYNRQIFQEVRINQQR